MIAKDSNWSIWLQCLRTLPKSIEWVQVDLIAFAYEIHANLDVNGVVVNEILSLPDVLCIPGVSFVPREANVAAYSIAHFVARSGGRLCWLGVVPSWLMWIIEDEDPVTLFY